MENSARVKFKLQRLNSSKFEYDQWPLLENVLKIIQDYGCFPIATDGSTCGNIAIKNGTSLIVSRSKRELKKSGPDNFVRVQNFDLKKWMATYHSASKSIKPTSDTPLHWTALMEAPNNLKWMDKPTVAIHGHCLATGKDAARLNVPITDDWAELSTPQDNRVFANLLKKYPYPSSKMFIRRGHGFFILGKNIEELVCESRKILDKARYLRLL